MISQTEEGLGSRTDGVTILIPARDEEDGITATLEEIRSVEERLDRPVEVLVIDDGSKDRTAEIALSAGARVIRHPESGGYGRSLKTGIANATYDTIVMTDADGTYPLGELPVLLEKAHHFDMVVGARTGPHFRHSNEPLQMAFLLMANFVTGRWIPDPNSGYRVFRRSQVLPILDRFPNGFSFSTTLTLVQMLTGRFVAFHPIVYGKRIGHSKVRFLHDALRAGQGMLEIILYHNPLKAFLAFSFLPLLAALVSLVLPLEPTARTIAVVVWMATAIVVFGLGMLAVAHSGTRRRG